jgi:antirestriction protein ArdC
MNDLYQRVTDRIVAALEAGTPPWIAPWRDGTTMPSNLATGKPYRGINVLMLHIEALDRGYPDSRWLTLKQANELGGRVRKGEHGTPIVFFRMKEVEDTDNGFSDPKGEETKRVVPMLKSYIVFNASQVEFLPERFQLGQQPQWCPQAEADAVLAQSGAVIRHGGNRAFYAPDEDFIQLPPPAWFPEAEGYYATALHELTHWTGHTSRLCRVLGRRQGIDAYAYEELVAEMGAAFLCAHCGIPGRLEHASYIDHWLDALKRDKRLIFVTAGAAQKAADFALGLSHAVPSPAAEVLAA